MLVRNSTQGEKLSLTQIFTQYPEETLTIARVLLEEAVIDTSFEEGATPKQWLMMPLTKEILAALELLKGHYNGGKEP